MSNIKQSSTNEYLKKTYKSTYIFNIHQACLYISTQMEILTTKSISKDHFVTRVNNLQTRNEKNWARMSCLSKILLKTTIKG